MILSLNSPLPEELLEAYGIIKAEGSICIENEGGTIMVLAALPGPTRKEIDGMIDEMSITLFIEKDIPFLVFKTNYFSFDMPITNFHSKLEGNALSFILVDSDSGLVKNIRVAGIAEKMIKEINEVLNITGKDRLEDIHNIMAENDHLSMIKKGKTYMVGDDDTKYNAL